jgi:hypothetical protein
LRRKLCSKRYIDDRAVETKRFYVQVRGFFRVLRLIFKQTGVRYPESSLRDAWGKAVKRVNAGVSQNLKPAIAENDLGGALKP